MHSHRVLLRKVRTFLTLPAFEMAWFVPIWIALGLARAMILTLHFRRLAPLLGTRGGIHPWVPLLDPSHEHLARHIGHGVRLAARYTPWESNCFPQAITARLLLGLYRVPYVLFLGVARSPEEAGMRAHAWVSAGRIRVTGGGSFGVYTVVGSFHGPELASLPGCGV